MCCKTMTADTPSLLQSEPAQPLHVLQTHVHMSCNSQRVLLPRSLNVFTRAEKNMTVAACIQTTET